MRPLALGTLSLSLFALIACVACGGRSSPVPPIDIGPPPPPPVEPEESRILVRDGDGSVPDPELLEGIEVLVDGQSTDAMVELDGLSQPSVTLLLTAGEHLVEVRRARFAAAVTTIVVPPEGGAEVSVFLQGEGLSVEGEWAVLEGGDDGVVPTGGTELTLVSSVDGEPVALESIARVDLADVGQGRPVDVTASFELVAGQPERIRAIGGLTALVPDATDFPNGVLLEVVGDLADGRVLEASTSFLIGQHEVDVALAAPPSRPGLDLAGLELTLSLVGGGPEWTATADSTGATSFAGVPTGTWLLRGTTTSAGDVFSLEGTVFVDRDVNVAAVPRTVVDVLAGVPGTTTTPQIATLTSLASDAIRPAAAELPEVAELSGADVVTAIAAGPGQRVERAAQYSLPAGTATASVVFEVSSSEYPGFVFSQSTFNDNWEITLWSASGERLYSLARNVNAQLEAFPRWRTGSTSGVIAVPVDVSALTVGGDSEVVLVVAATNIGDSAAPTAVSARVDVDDRWLGPVAIAAVESACVTRSQRERLRVSVPWAGGVQNVVTRTAAFELIGPAMPSAVVESVRVDLIDGVGGGVLATVFDELAGSPRWSQDGDAFVVDLTFTDDAPSTIPNPGVGSPPTARIHYRITVRVNDGVAVDEIVGETEELFPLWQIPAVAMRCGRRESGGDGWCARGVSEWLSTNAMLLSRVDDLSGEHARNLCNADHRFGTDIELAPFGSDPSRSELANLATLEQLVARALDDDAAARADLVALVGVERNSLEALLANTSVHRLFVGLGWARPTGASGPALPDGWARSLLVEGAVESPDGQVLDLAIGTWSPTGAGKLRFDHVHDDHLRVQLDPILAR